MPNDLSLSLYTENLCGFLRNKSNGLVSLCVIDFRPAAYTYVHVTGSREDSLRHARSRAFCSEAQNVARVTDLSRVRRPLVRILMFNCGLIKVFFNVSLSAFLIFAM